MKKILTLLLSIIFASSLRAQDVPLKTTIPPYHILKTDSTYITPADISKNKPVVIIYFSPDCTHCQHLMMEITPRIKDFKDAQIVMITFAQLKAIKNFYRDYGLVKYPNITVATEGYTYFTQKYYNVKKTPFTAIYDRKQQLVKTFENVPKIDDITDILKTMPPATKTVAKRAQHKNAAA